MSKYKYARTLSRFADLGCVAVDVNICDLLAVLLIFRYNANVELASVMIGEESAIFRHQIWG